MLGTVMKQPVDQLDYPIRFGKWLSIDDSITNASVDIQPAGELTCTAAQITEDEVKVWLVGGVDGALYHVETTITTAAGRKKAVVFRVRVKDE